MTPRQWADVDDDELLSLLGAALAPPETNGDRLPVAPAVPLRPVTFVPRRRSWLAAAAAVLALGAGAAAVAALGDGGADVVVAPATSTTTPIEGVAERADELEAALAEQDVQAVADSARALRESVARVGIIGDPAFAQRVADLLDQADARLAAGSTSTTVSATTGESLPPPPAVTTGSTPEDDISGPCDEAEHADDPRCTGAGEEDSSGPGGPSGSGSDSGSGSSDSSGPGGGSGSGSGSNDDP